MLRGYRSSIFRQRPTVHLMSIEASGLKEEVMGAIESAIGHSFSAIGDAVSGFTVIGDLLDSLELIWTGMGTQFRNATGFLEDIKSSLNTKLSGLETKLGGIGTALGKVGEIPGKVQDVIDSIPTFDELKGKAEDIMVNFTGGIFDGIATAMESGLINLQREVGMVRGFSHDDAVRAMDLFTRIRSRAQSAGRKVTTAVFQFMSDLANRAGRLLITLHPEQFTWKSRYDAATRMDTKIRVIFDAYYELLLIGMAEIYETVVVPVVRGVFEILGTIITPIAEGVWNAIASAFSGLGASILEGMGIKHSWGGLNRAIGIEDPMWQVVTFFGTTLITGVPLAFLYDSGFVKLIDYTTDRVGGVIGSTARALLGGGA